MRLAKAASFFNRMTCRDGYTGQTLFRGQLGLYDDTKRDSETAERRILSLAPDVIIPPRRVIDAAGTRWIIGHGNPDDFKGQTIRVGYTVHEAPLLATVFNLHQLAMRRAGTAMYMGRAWLKDRAYAEHSSELNTQYHLHFSSFEKVVPEDIVSLSGGPSYLVRAINPGAAGTLIALADEMPEPVVEYGTIINGTYDPLTETLSGSPDQITVVRLRWQSLFEYATPGAPKFGPGDLQIAIGEAVAAARPGARLTLSDGVWQLHSVTPRAGVFLCRAVRHG